MISTKVKPTLSRYGNSLRYRDFRWVMLGSLGGQSAYWALIIARGVLVLEMTGSSALVGVATFAAMVPRFLMPPVAGYLADRFDRRSVLVIAYVLQFFNVLAIGWVGVRGFIEHLDSGRVVVAQRQFQGVPDDGDTSFGAEFGVKGRFVECDRA